MNPSLMPIILIVGGALFILGAMAWFYLRQKDESARQMQELARQIIEAHNGFLHIASKIDQGTTVEIILPVPKD